MAQAARLASRLHRELKMLQIDPPPGVCAWPCNDLVTHLEAQIEGPQGTVYANGIFKLDIQVPERYPFEPPNIKFVTPVYHPNIDDGGRICLDILNLPPKGAWRPSLNLATLLASIGLLLSEPNPDDGLMGDITAEYKHDRLTFDVKAKKWTELYAIQGQGTVKMPAVEINNCETSAISSVPSKGVDRMPMEDKDGESVTMISAFSHLTKQVGFLSKRLSLGRGTQNLHHDNMPNGPLYHERNFKVPQTDVSVHSSSLTNVSKEVKLSAQEIQGKEHKLIETHSVHGARQREELCLRHTENKEETSESDKQGRFSQEIPKHIRCSQEIPEQERVSQEPPSKVFNKLAPGTSPNSIANKKQVESPGLENAFDGFSDVPPTQVCKRTNRSQQAPAMRTDGCRKLVSREEDEDLKRVLVTSRAVAESTTGVMAKELKESEKTADPHTHSGTVNIVNSASTLSGPSEENKIQPWNEKENQAPKQSAFSCVVASTVDSGRGRLKLMKEAASQAQPKHVCIEAANGCHTPSLPRVKSLKLSRAKVDSQSLSGQLQDHIRIANPERRSIPSSIVIPDDDAPTVIVSDSGSDDDELPAEDFTFSLTQPSLISSNKRKAGSRLR